MCEGKEEKPERPNEQKLGGSGGIRLLGDGVALLHIYSDGQ